MQKKPKVTIFSPTPYFLDILFLCLIGIGYYQRDDLFIFNGRDKVVFMNYAFLYMAFFPLYILRIAIIVAIIRKSKEPMTLEKKIAKFSFVLFMLLIVPGMFSSGIWASLNGYKSCFRVERRAPLYLYVPKNKECPEPPTLDQYIHVHPNPYMDIYKKQNIHE
ncbi:hypothetical protein GE253_12985 [Niveispirillum sp. SYP-B3756]|uniref:hypothetical protein n=1 Tax=Niveispirillum sp. SYP-B3756 TaxID=2662178 RepID=UPI00129208CB|nr:hypothetical protein [Niveispirillum sp. SYP-B3756]MQP66255.1 hypothetical protein [Niveispirillum sp. SYP-B3756]